LQTWQREWERRIASFFRFFSLSTFHSLVSASSCLNLHRLPQPVLQAPFAKSRGTSTRRSSSVWCALMTGIASERTAPNTPTPVSIALLVPLFTHTHTLSLSSFLTTCRFVLFHSGHVRCLLLRRYKREPACRARW
jgi:hypothetical protein